MSQVQQRVPVGAGGLGAPVHRAEAACERCGQRPGSSFNIPIMQLCSLCVCVVVGGGRNNCSDVHIIPQISGNAPRTIPVFRYSFACWRSHLQTHACVLPSAPARVLSRINVNECRLFQRLLARSSATLCVPLRRSELHRVPGEG